MKEILPAGLGYVRVLPMYALCIWGRPAPEIVIIQKKKYKQETSF